MLIWWLNQTECEAIGEHLPKAFPKYLRDQYRSRLGRAGRGRLWVDEQFGEVGVDPWPDTPLGKQLGADSGGIVIRDEDAVLLKDLPGVTTDLKLKRS